MTDYSESAGFSKINFFAFIAGGFVLAENIQVGGPAFVLLDAALGAALVFTALPMLRASASVMWPMFLLPAWALISVFWSADPLGTIRYGLQLTLTCIAGICIAELVAPRRFVLLLFLATLAFAVICIVSRRTGPATDAMVLVGLTGSKNQMSFVGQMVISTALAIGVDRERPLGWRLLTLPALLIGAYLVAVTRSATGILTSAFAVGTFVALTAYKMTASSLRAWLLVGLILAGLGTLVVTPELLRIADGVRQNVLHKDATLTGRTYLWSVASQVISERPLLGHGYKAFWSSGSTESIGLLRSVNVTDPRGFGFQDTYREIVVDLGFIGLGLFAVAAIPAVAQLVHRELILPTHTDGFLVTTALVFAVRSTTDMSVEPMYIYTTLIYALCVYGWHAALPRAAGDRRAEAFR